MIERIGNVVGSCAVAAVVALVGFAAPAQAAGGFAVEIVRGIEQKRKLSTPGQTAVPRVRKLGPDDEVVTVIVKVPDAWLKDPPRTESKAAVAAKDAADVDAVLADLRALKLIEPTIGPLALAGRVAGVFQVADDGGALRPLDVRLWHAWEVLVDAEHADTLSAAVAATSALAKLSVTARICSYSSAAGGAFAVVVDAAVPAGATFAFPLTDGAAALLPLHPRAQPKGPLSTSSLHCSTLAQVLDPAFVPGAGVKPLVPPPTTPPTTPTSPDPTPTTPGVPDAPPRVIEPPDVDDQARALGIKEDHLYLGASALAALVMCIVAGLAIGAALTRSKRAKQAVDRKKQERF